MEPYKLVSIIWMASTIYQVAADTEILLKVPKGKTWAWYISPHSISDGAGWNSPSSHLMIYSVCDIQSNTEPKNWLRTGFIPLKDAKLLEIKMGYKLKNCPDDSSMKNCKTYLDIYALHTNKTLLTDDSDPGLVTQYEFVDRITPGVKLEPGEVREFTYHGKFIANAKGVYLAFLDQGVCIVLQNFTLGYKFCSEKGNDLVTFPRTVAPANDSQVEEKDGKCSDSHSVSKGRLSGVCLSSGGWNITDEVRCVCMKGYELVETELNSLGCRECSKGFYKNMANNEKCVECPANSFSDTARTGCICNVGFYVLADEEHCATLPQGPTNAKTAVVKATYVTINWTRSPDDNDTGILRYSVDCFRCMFPREEECKESCGPSVKYRPSKDNITDVWVTVHGLQPDSIFQFRVYSVSELNQQEKDRDKWKYITIRVRTKAVVTPVVQKGNDLSTDTLKGTEGIIVGVSLFVIIILVVCCVLYRRQKKQIDKNKQLYLLQQSDYKIDSDRSLLEQCNDLPYDPDWEFPEERLLLGNILGAGAFGQVIQAEAIGILALNPRNKSAESFKRRLIRRSSRAKELKKEEGNGGWKNVKIPVAVKTLKEGASREEYKDLASELKILIHLGQHKNIVNLLGACTRGKRLMVIMEFAPHGSLLSFLRGKRDIHEATWTKTMNDPEKEFTLVDLVMTGFQVARGMSFLASRKCVHRDLAARNILVGEDYVMKIADFGLARDIYKDDLYVKKTQGLLPVKWMAPESLFDRIYTEKTDVWSFGILLWEAFTLGGTPYPGLPTEQLLDYLSDGKRMDMPARCPLEVYTIMRDCWIKEPEQRPKFTTLTERLASILEKNTSKDNPYLALQMEEEAQPSQGYYLQPVDDGGIRDSKRYVKSPVHSPTSDTSEPPNFGDAGSAHKGADRMGYDSPLPTLPPGLPVMSDEDIPHDPLPPLPPYETSRSDSAGGESGIDVDAVDDGYVDDARADSPFLPRPGNKPVAIQMDKYNKVPEEKILPKGRYGNYETEL